MPDAGSNTNSVEKLGPTAAGLGSSSNVRAGLFRVKSSIAESKSKAEGRGAAVGLGVGLAAGRVTAGKGEGAGALVGENAGCCGCC